MATAAPIPSAQSASKSTLVADYMELVKPRVTLMVLITAAAASTSAAFGPA
jgi:heme o synthase